MRAIDAKPKNPVETKQLTDNLIKGLRNAPPAKGERVYVRSRDHKYVLICITPTLAADKKPRAAFLYGSRRFPNSASSGPTRRELGTYPSMSIARAHEKAREWDKLIELGVDPQDERVRLADEAARAKKAAADTAFSVVAERYLKFAQNQRQIKETTRIIERELLPAWDSRPIETITATEIKGLIVSIAEKHPAMARNVLTVIKSLFAWHFDEASPASALKPKRLIGEKKPRQRLLGDDEIRAFWAATESFGYPYRDLYRFLLLTGVRLREAADARWSEIDLATRTWTIPPERFKSDTYHFVRLSDQAVALLKGLKRFDGCEFLFTHDGARPVRDFSRAKARLDARMAAQLGHRPKPWVIHDLRRVVRTKLAALKVSDLVAELILGHGKKGVQRVYDLAGREDDMLDAMKAWDKKLHAIVSAKPATVLKLRGRA